MKYAQKALVVLALVVLVSVHSSAEDISFMRDTDGTIIHLGGLQGDLGGLLWGVTNEGQVVGYWSDSYSRVYVWDREQGVRDIGALGAKGAQYQGMTENGQVWGRSADVDGKVQTFIWDEVNGMRVPNFLDRLDRILDMNDVGQMLVSSVSLGLCIWDAENGFQPVSCAGDYALDGRINNNGQFAYSTFVDDSGNNVQKIFFCDQESQVDIGVCGWNSMVMYFDLNDAGAVVGRPYDESGELHTFIWDSVSGLSDLSFYATDLNNNGQVVGYCRDGFGVRHCVIWDPTAGLQEIQGVPGEIDSNGLVFNDVGEMCGTYSVPEPVPEPSCLAALTFGICGIALCGRKKTR